MRYLATLVSPWSSCDSRCEAMVESKSIESRREERRGRCFLHSAGMGRSISARMTHSTYMDGGGQERAVRP